MFFLLNILFINKIILNKRSLYLKKTIHTLRITSENIIGMVSLIVVLSPNIPVYITYKAYHYVTRR